MNYKAVILMFFVLGTSYLVIAKPIPKEKIDETLDSLKMNTIMKGVVEYIDSIKYENCIEFVSNDVIVKAEGDEYKIIDGEVKIRLLPIVNGTC